MDVRLMEAPDAPRPQVAGRGDDDDVGGARRGRPDDSRLLAALPHAVRERLQPRLERVRLTMKQVLYQPGRPIEHVFFPISGVISLFAVMAEGKAIEVATVGNEGLLGVPVFLGAAAFPGRAMCQMEGEAWRMPADAFRRQARRDPPLRDLLQRYVQAYIDQISQSAGCNRTHALQQRCARWLLMTHDRVTTDRFVLTQEFLASMLGVRRPTVSQIMRTLRRTGILNYSRGRVTILDRRGLEAAACECYRIVKDEYDRLLGEASTNH